MARILVVDDNASVLQTLDYCLGKDGHTVLTASDGATGLELAVREDMDLVILDVEMPKMRGIAVCRVLKADPRTARIPVLIITAALSPEIKREATAAGALAVIPKPFDVDALQALIAGTLPGPGGAAPA